MNSSAKNVTCLLTDNIMDHLDNGGASDTLEQQFFASSLFTTAQILMWHEHLMWLVSTDAEFNQRVLP